MTECELSKTVELDTYQLDKDHLLPERAQEFDHVWVAPKFIVSERAKNHSHAGKTCQVSFEPTHLTDYQDNSVFRTPITLMTSSRREVDIGGEGSKFK